ncbi:hypothetical protein SKAU_G00125230 [Synaphobranchus kaupii]|uniref:Uncharacterized protein n=1 Tax=Synaphobranchus kaupii TaxID=118154 RepID=A0A9Q1J0N9_SYNKA|nr:hypothetical protein SKAU_G00125230 [Synaphobranchus kaupii]
MNPDRGPGSRSPLIRAPAERRPARCHASTDQTSRGDLERSAGLLAEQPCCRCGDGGSPGQEVQPEHFL